MIEEREEEQEEIEQNKCPICNCKMATENKFCSIKCYNEFQNK